MHAGVEKIHSGKKETTSMLRHGRILHATTIRYKPTFAGFQFVGGEDRPFRRLEQRQIVGCVSGRA
jgi:hypothetical protein